jgi:hypothetical protein
MTLVAQRHAEPAADHHAGEITSRIHLSNALFGFPRQKTVMSPLPKGILTRIYTNYRDSTAKRVAQKAINW